MQTLVLIRYGEIGLKGRNRPAFEQRLERRVRRALQPVGGRVWREHGRLFAEAPVDWPQMRARLQTVFGIVSFSPVRRTALDKDAIAAAARDEMSSVLTERPRGRATFKVTARRADKRFEMTSMEIARWLGQLLLASAPDGYELKVDVHDPDLTVNVEIREQAAFVFAHTATGPGGLPVGSSGRALALLSGGIDSPVAVWMLMKRGVTVDAVHFHSYPFTSDRSKEKVMDLARTLAVYGGPFRLNVVHFTDIQTAIARHCPPELGVIIMRRMMYRIADAIAAESGALALITGESVGQVASQTLNSIQVTAAATSFPVLRPLVGLDKAEIVELATKIGTYETSILPYEDCCTLFVSPHPKTKPRLAEVERAEQPLDLDALIPAALERTETMTFDDC